VKRPILTAAETRAAEEVAIAAGTTAEMLMERAGLAAAEAIWRHAGPTPALVLCGPGNNGGDGYVIARALAGRGVEVRVAALDEPATPAAAAARTAWRGPVAGLDEAKSAPLLIDALFGTGLARPLDGTVSARLQLLAREARLCAAIDLPSGVSADDGAILSPVPRFDLTITFASLKPAHLLHPAAASMGRVAVADIGLDTASDLHALQRPALPPPGPCDHKYSRGYVLLVAGEMPGAAALAAGAALRAGAGYVRILADRPIHGVPAAIVQSSEAELLQDARIGCVLVGPGLGLGYQSTQALEAALGSGLPLVLDGDALTLLGTSGRKPPRGSIMTPHAGEFARLFPGLSGSKLAQARTAAARTGAVVVFKGADTVIATPGAQAVIGAGPSWLATAGTGDVLAGIVAAMRAGGLEPFEAACAGVWLHARAAELAGPALIADDLADRLSAAVAECV
jgi:hydroxyethylthiazole kinase-like uncharacterized protein yjeF